MGQFLSCLVASLEESGDAPPAALRAAVPGPTGRTAQRSAFLGPAALSADQSYPLVPSSGTSRKRSLRQIRTIDTPSGSRR